MSTALEAHIILYLLLSLSYSPKSGDLLTAFAVLGTLVTSALISHHYASIWLTPATWTITLIGSIMTYSALSITLFDTYTTFARIIRDIYDQKISSKNPYLEDPEEINWDDLNN